ncbi:MAG: SulP family inorganic anion transporter [Pseudomonadota bacterium]
MRHDTHPASEQRGAISALLKVAVGLGSGLVIGLVAAVTTVSVAAIAYSGELDVFAGAGAIVTLAGTAVAMVISALTLSYSGTVLGAQNITAVTLSLAASALAACGSGVAPPHLFQTVALMMALTTLATGVFFVVLGASKAGALARYVPYPVVGGFLAATGVLLVLAALAMSSGRAVSVFDLPDMVTTSPVLRWAPTICIAVILSTVAHLAKHPAALTGTLALSFATFYATLGITGTSLEDARTLGLLLGAPSSPQTLSLADLNIISFAAGADFSAIIEQTPKLLTVSALAALAMVMSATGLEHATKSDIDLDRDFVGVGLANLGAGALGGLPVYHYFGATALAYTLHMRSWLLALLTAGVCLTLVLAGSTLIENLPVCVLAGLSMFIGANLIREWLIERRSTLPALDYGVVVLIVGVMVGVGFLEGVATGLIACVVIFVILSGRQDVVMRSFSSAVRHSMVDRGPEARNAILHYGHRNHIVELKGHLFFGTANRLYQEVMSFLAQSQPLSLVLDFRRVQSIDSSAVYSFEKLVQRCQHHGTRIAVTGLSDRLGRASGLSLALARGKAVAFDDQDEGMEWAEDRLLNTLTFEGDGPANGKLLSIFKTLAGHSALVKQLLPGDALVNIGEPSNGYYMVEDGQLAVTIPTQDGKGFRIRTVGPGALIGEVGHYTGAARTATVAAQTPCQVLHLTQNALDQLERDDPASASTLHKYAAQYLATRLTENTLLVEHSR